MSQAATQSSADQVFRFGNVVIDAGRREVRVEGQPVEVQPKVFDLLRHLVANRDRVVDKDELMAVLWPGVVVTESSLTQALKKARRIVGDDGERQTVIRTVQRRGFRFVAPLQEATVHPPAAEARPPPAGPSVAVLAFTDMSPNQDQRHFCEGMADEIIGALTRVEGLRVAARTSSFAFRGSSADVREIAARLGVSSVVEGSARRFNDQLRVVAHLIDAVSGFHRWSERWDRPVVDVFAIQDEIATRVAEALKAELTSADRAAIPASRTRETGAYDLYLRGLCFLRGFGRRNQRFAVETFRRALQIDPNYAPAWAGLATSYALLYHFSDASEEHRRQASEAGARAVAIDPDSAEARVARGVASTLNGAISAADVEFRKAEELNPRLFEAWYFHGRACAAKGDHARAVELYEEAARTRPEDHEALNLAVQSYMSLGREEEAMDAARRSAAAVERAVALDPEDVRALSLGSGLLVMLGRHAEAREWVRRSCALEPDEPYVIYNAACVFVLLGEHDAALDHLERVGVELMANRSWMRQDSTLAPLHGHPRFEALIGRAR